MDFNIIRFLFLVFGIIVSVLGLLINALGEYIPVAISRSFLFGKFADKRKNAFVMKSEVPKRWFAHFYLFGAPVYSIFLYLTIQQYFYNDPELSWFISILDFLLGSSRKALVSAEASTVALSFITIHVWKRVYETQCVSVFSDAKINITHYMLGYLHYIGTLLCILGETEGFVSGTRAEFSWYRVSPLHIIYGIVILWASYKQLESNFILSNLRKNKKGEVVSTGYKIPRGALFEYVSAPLQLTEITIYGMLSLILWNSSTYHYIFFWVLSNQALCAVTSHFWYRKTFKDYPPQRKMLVPFLL